MAHGPTPITQSGCSSTYTTSKHNPAKLIECTGIWPSTTERVKITGEYQSIYCGWNTIGII